MFICVLPASDGISCRAGWRSTVQKNKITKTFFTCAIALVLFFMILFSTIGSVDMSSEQYLEMVRNNFIWFWYTVQTVTAAGFGFYYWKRTRTIEL